ncbi:MAG: histidine kinase [Fusicatenibacter sp.]|nr:histidine kinase [Fusicatenibacter sp.]
MKGKRKNGVSVLQTILIILAAAFLIGLFVLTGVSRNVNIIETRSDGESVQIRDYTWEEREQEGAPTGTIEEYRFRIPTDLMYDTSLCFYVVHQYVQVYLDGECIYCMESSGALPMIKTPGCSWVMLPVYREDAGKEVRIVITPVYDNIRKRTVEFLLGPKENVILNQFRKDWLPAAICELLMAAGVILIGYSIYYIKVYKQGWELIDYGILSACIGIWRYLDMRSASFMLPDQSVFLFYVSVGTMMFGMIPLMMSLKQKIRRNFVDGYTILVAFLCILIVVLQLFGIADLREFLFPIQIVFLVSLAIMLISEISSQKKKGSKTTLRTVTIFLLAIGSVMDFIVYYVKRTSADSYFLLSALLLVFLVAAFSHMVDYIRQAQKLEKQENQIVQSRVTAMVGQIRSHFVFNILNAISGMCKYDPEKADRTVICFARYLRTNIDIMQEDQPVPFRTELSHLEDYIELEKVRFGNKIRFEKEIEMDQFLIPLLVLQPLVENSIKHGLIEKPQGGTIFLRTWKEGETVKISLQDDGVGFDVNVVKEKAVGIPNVRFRLQYMVGGKLEIESTPGCGTVATITLPLETNKTRIGEK